MTNGIMAGVHVRRNDMEDRKPKARDGASLVFL
jgi:hypothetical protein